MTATHRPCRTLPPETDYAESQQVEQGREASMKCDCCGQVISILLRQNGKKICWRCDKYLKARKAREIEKKAETARKRAKKMVALKAAELDAARAALRALPIATRMGERYRKPVFAIAGHEGRFHWRDAGVASIHPEYIAKGWVMARVERHWPGRQTGVWVRVAFEPVPKTGERPDAE